LLDPAERKPNDILTAEATRKIAKTDDLVHRLDYYGTNNFALHLFPLFHERVSLVFKDHHSFVFVNNGHLWIHNLVEGTRLHFKGARYRTDGTA